MTAWLKSAFGLVLAIGVGLGVATPAQAERTTTYLHTDGLGSVVAASCESGNVLWRKSYAPYGEQIDAQGDDEALSYTGKPHDADLGLTYFGARYYDPVVGRFLSPDPVGFVLSNHMSFNRYLYANNNPYAYVDPDGKWAVAAAELLLLLQRIGAALTGAIGGAYVAEEVVQPVLNEANEEGAADEAAEEPEKKPRRSKNRLSDRGEPGTVSENAPGTTRKRYGPDGWVEKEWNQGHGPSAPKDEQGDHVHDYKPNPNHPDGRPTRQPGRKPRPRDLNDMDKL